MKEDPAGQNVTTTGYFHDKSISERDFYHHPADPTRPNWDDIWLNVANVMKDRSLCDRDHVGAVIVDKTNRIIATGYNGPPQGFRHENTTCRNWCTRAISANTPVDPIDPCYRDCPSLHAEQNAISVCDRNAREGGTIYVTSHVCITCAKLIANSGIVQVIVRPNHPAAYRSPVESYEFLASCGITVDVLTVN